MNWRKLERVKARIHKESDGGCRIECQRAKFKHWFALGCHAETDTAFAIALRAGAVEWEREIRDASRLI